MVKVQKPTPGLEVCGPEGSPDYWGVISEMASVRVRCPTYSPQSSSNAAFARCDGVHQREHRNQNHPLAFVSFFHLTLRRGVGLARDSPTSVAKHGSESDGGKRSAASVSRSIVDCAKRAERAQHNQLYA